MKELLYKFLVQEGALFNYLEIAPSIEHVCDKYSPQNFICWFLWKDTKQGSHYWMCIESAWCKFYSYRNGTNI